MALFFLDALLVLVGAALATAVFRWRSLTAAVCCFYVLAWSEVVFAAEVASLTGLRWDSGFALVHAVFAVGAALLWMVAGYPAFRFRDALDCRRGDLARSLRREPDLWVLLAAVVGLWGLGAVLAVVVPPNNYDSMTYHLARVGYWLQHGSFRHWETSNLRQTMPPMNAEIGALWTMAFLRSDRLVNLVQWTAGVVSAIAIVGLARRLGHSRPRALFAAGLFATLPQVVLQSTSSQNDLVAASFLVIALFLAIDGVQGRRFATMIPAGAAVGLAFGTKVTALMTVPGLAIAWLFYLWRTDRAGRARLGALALFAVVGFVSLGAYNYVQNVVLYGHPLGSREFVEHQSQTDGLSWSLVKANAVRDLFHPAYLDPSPRLEDKATNEDKDVVDEGAAKKDDGVADDDEATTTAVALWRAAVGKTLYRVANVEPDTKTVTWPVSRYQMNLLPFANEDWSWFWPLGALVWLPATLWSLGRGLRRREAERFLPAVVAVAFVVALCAAQAWHPWRGRLYVIPVACAAPLVAGVFRRGWFGVGLRWLLVGVAVFVLFQNATLNDHKPVFGEDAIWSMDRIERRAHWIPHYEPILRTLKEELPTTATVVVMIGGDDWEYPIFGPRLTRKLIHVLPPETVSENWLMSRNEQYFVIRHPDHAYITWLSRRHFEVVNAGLFKIVKKRSSPADYSGEETRLQKLRRQWRGRMRLLDRRHQQRSSDEGS